MDLRFRPDLKPRNNRFLLGALKNQAKSKKEAHVVAFLSSVNLTK